MDTAMEPTEQPHDDPFSVGQITERLPAWELWDDGVEPEVEDEEKPQVREHERAA